MPTRIDRDGYVHFGKDFFSCAQIEKKNELARNFDCTENNDLEVSMTPTTYLFKNKSTKFESDSRTKGSLQIRRYVI